MSQCIGKFGKAINMSELWGVSCFVKIGTKDDPCAWNSPLTLNDCLMHGYAQNVLCYENVAYPTLCHAIANTQNTKHPSPNTSIYITNDEYSCTNISS